MKTKSLLALTAAALLGASLGFAAPLGTAFTYQGRLNDGGVPATGNYDMLFNLYDDPTNGNVLGSFSIFGGVPVTNGFFTVELNSYGEFGSNAFNGQARWLQIGVRTNNNNAANPWIDLSPRQPVTCAPQALFAADVADGAITGVKLANGAVQTSNLAPGTLDWSNLTGIPADFADGTDNDTAYTAGAGLNLSGANEFSVNFDGAGSADTAARSDHQHFGASWNGNASFANGLSVTNSAANGGGLFGQQGAGSGFPYIFGNTAGVWGESSEGSGVHGASGYSSGSGVLGIGLGQSGHGVYGLAISTNGTNYGVYGKSSSTAGSGVFGLGRSAAINSDKTSFSGNSVGVMGESADGFGVIGVSDAFPGVFGSSVSGAGVAGKTASHFGVVGQATASAGIGVVALNNNGVAFKAAGTGIIQSDADSVIWFPAAGITRNYADSGFQIAPNSVDMVITANEVRTCSVELPLNLPSVLYGQPVTVKAVQIFYKCSNGARSPVTSAVLYHVHGDGTFNIADSLSGFETSNVPASFTLTPNTTLSATDGFMSLHLAAAINDTSDAIHFYGARVVLGHK